jgi:hypothetical protein
MMTKYRGRFAGAEAGAARARGSDLPAVAPASPAANAIANQLRLEYSTMINDDPFCIECLAQSLIASRGWRSGSRNLIIFFKDHM